MEVSRRYVPSELEERWFRAAERWKQGGNAGLADLEPFCAELDASLPDIKRALQLTGTLMKAGRVRSRAPDADRLLSRFEVEYGNGTHSRVVKQHIEPLVAALRHPLSVLCSGIVDAHLMDVSYILLAARHRRRAAGVNILLDAGAAVGYRKHSDQGWLIDSYEARGLALDLMVYWEAVPRKPEEVYKDVPQKLFPNFIYYNIPAPANLSHDGNPLNMMTRIAGPEDFVSIKIDIDTPAIESLWLNAIMQTTSPPNPYAPLIDELFFEHHFSFKPLVDCCWGTGIDNGTELVDSMRMFRTLREMGIRAHYWV